MTRLQIFAEHPDSVSERVPAPDVARRPTRLDGSHVWTAETCDRATALRIASEVGRGTTVSLAFPHADAAPRDIVIDARLNMRPVHPG